MQKIAAQVGDKKLIKLRLYRQTESSTRSKTESGREAREGEEYSWPVDPWLSVSQVPRAAAAWTSVGGCRRGASRVRAVKII